MLWRWLLWVLQRQQLRLFHFFQRRQKSGKATVAASDLFCRSFFVAAHAKVALHSPSLFDGERKSRRNVGFLGTIFPCQFTEGNSENTKCAFGKWKKKGSFREVHALLLSDWQSDKLNSRWKSREKRPFKVGKVFLHTLYFLFTGKSKPSRYKCYSWKSGVSYTKTLRSWVRLCVSKASFNHAKYHWYGVKPC